MSRRSTQSFRLNNFSGGVTGRDFWSREDDVKSKNALALCDNMVLLPSGALCTRPPMKSFGFGALRILIGNAAYLSTVYNGSTYLIIADQIRIYLIKSDGNNRKAHIVTVDQKVNKAILTNDRRRPPLMSVANGFLYYSNEFSGAHSVSLSSIPKKTTADGHSEATVFKLWTPFNFAITLKYKHTDAEPVKSTIPNYAVFCALVEYEGKTYVSGYTGQSLEKTDFVDLTVEGSKGSVRYFFTTEVSSFERMRKTAYSTIDRFYEMPSSGVWQDIFLKKPDAINAAAYAKGIGQIATSYQGRNVTAYSWPIAKLYFSRLDDYNYFGKSYWQYISNGASDAFSLALDCENEVRIQGLFALERLFVFTTVGIWVVYSVNLQEVSKDATRGYRASRIASIECSSIPPVLSGNSIIFHSSSNNHIYSVQSSPDQGNVLVDLSMRCPSLFKTKVKSIHAFRSFSNYLICVLEDGSFLMSPLDLEQNVLGWTRHYICTAKYAYKVVHAYNLVSIDKDQSIGFCVMRQEIQTNKRRDPEKINVVDLEEEAFFSSLPGLDEPFDDDLGRQNKIFLFCQMRLQDIDNTNPISVYDDLREERSPVVSGFQTVPYHFLTPVNSQVSNMHLRCTERGEVTVRSVMQKDRVNSGVERNSSARANSDFAEVYMPAKYDFVQRSTTISVAVKSGFEGDLSVQVAASPGHKMRVNEYVLEVS